MEIYKKIITTVAAVSLLLTPVTAFAQITAIQGGLGTAAGGAGYQKQDLTIIIGKIIGSALSLLGIVLLGMLIYGGVLWMTAQGEEKKVKDARQTITNAIIGLVIVVISYALADWVLGALLAAMGGTSPGTPVSTPTP